MTSPTVLRRFLAILALLLASLPAGAAPKAFVTNIADDTVSVIALDTRTVVKTINVGDEPSFVAVTPDGSRAYVSNMNSNNVSVIDTGTLTVVGTVPVGMSPVRMAVSTSGAKIYVVNSGSDNVSVIDRSTNTVTATIPIPFDASSIAYHPVRDEIWVGGTSVHVYSATDHSLLASLNNPSAQYASSGFAFRPDGNEVFTSESCGFCGRFHRLSGNHSGGTIAVLQPDILSDGTGSATGLAVNSVTGVAYLGKEGQNGTPSINESGVSNRALTLAAQPREVAVSRDGTLLYVVIHGAPGSVNVINTQTFQSVDSIPVGNTPSGIAIADVTERAFVTNTTDDTVSVIALDTRAVVKTIGVGDEPAFVAVTPDGARVYVSNTNSNNVSVIDTAALAVVTTIPVGEGPLRLAISNSGAKIYVVNGGSDSVSVIDRSTNSVTATIPIPFDASSIAYHPVRDEIWVGGTSVHVYSAADHSLLASLNNPSAQYASSGFAFRPDGNEVFTSESCGFCGRFHRLSGNHSGGTIAVLQPDILSDGTGSATGLVVNPVTGVAYLGKEGQNGTPSINESGGSNRALTLAKQPREVAVSRDGTLLYVVIHGTPGSVNIINTQTFQSVGTIPVGNAPSGIAIATVANGPANGPPGAVTLAATNVGTSSAKLNGLVDPNNNLATATFQFGLTTAYGSSVDAGPAPGMGDDPVAVSATISGLAPNQTYHYRLVAMNSVGTTNGDDLTFTTGAIPPAVTTGLSSNVTSTEATVGGTVNPNGAAVTSAVVEFGLTTSYGTSVNVLPAPGNGSAPVSVAATLSGLSPGTTYHYRVTATNQAGAGSGEDRTFTTRGMLPLVATGAAVNLSATGATVQGSVTPNGLNTIATFEYGLDTTYGQTALATPAPGSGTQSVSVSAVLSGLLPNQTYHYRLTATNADGTTIGSDATFVTSFIATPDRVFAALGEPTFTIEVLANDQGTDLSIQRVNRGALPEIRVQPSKTSINFLPAGELQFSLPLEEFTYVVRDFRNDPQFEVETPVTVFYFTNLKGTYFGNVSAPGSGRVLRFRLDMDYKGIVTGRFEWEGEQYSFKKDVDHKGVLKIERVRVGGQFISLSANFVLDPIAMVFEGTFRDEGPNPETFNISLQFQTPILVPVPDNGTIIAFIDPEEESTIPALTSRTRGAGQGNEKNIPEGIGFVQIKLKNKRARFIGKMPDFGAFSTGKTEIAAFNGISLPRYEIDPRPIRRGNSKPLGEVGGDAFLGKTLNGSDRIHGQLKWRRFLTASVPQELVTFLDGFPYQRGPNDAPPGFPVSNISNARVKLSGGGLDTPIEFEALLNKTKGKVAAGVKDDHGFKLKVNPVAGIVNGSFTHPVTKKKAVIAGGVGGELGFFTNLPDRNARIRGSFYDKSSEKTGRITITAKD
jgi:YVTN family beta-propeller protein